MSVRNNPFSRNMSPSPSPSPGPGPGSGSNGIITRPRSAISSASTSSTLSGVPMPLVLHGRNHSQSLVGASSTVIHHHSHSHPHNHHHHRPSHSREISRGTIASSTSTSTTFAPSFIKSEEMRRQTEEAGAGAGAGAAGAGAGVVKGIEGENDFSGKRYVWLKDPEAAFVKGWIVEELEEGRILVQCDDGSQREVDTESVDKVNPAKFDKANDMAELTHLNEASVVHNLHTRYQSDLIYTYSGLFLVTVNPYCPLPIYTAEYVNMYKGRGRNRDGNNNGNNSNANGNKPHIFAMADEAFRNLVEEGQNQSILVTGESGAGKTENTKKVIQYLAAVAQPPPVKGRQQQSLQSQQQSTLSAQILRANPILEAFGNAQTVRNNNSSRFGKFIRIEFSRSGSIAGAFIDWYLLEKSRVVHVNPNERNYHIFYQLLRGGLDSAARRALFLEGCDVADFAYTREGRDSIAGVSDVDEWDALMEAFAVMGFSEDEQAGILRTMAAVLHLGNITVVKESRSADQARLAADARDVAAKACRLLGVPLEPFLQGLLHPRVRAGREWVEKVQTPEQVRLGIDALAKGIYERGFGDLVARINRQLDRAGNMAGVGGGGIVAADDYTSSSSSSHFIGVLDIAGFEIFEHNSFEQLCINYTNEKLQQFFNHHMFVLEQEEYAREQIEWQFIDFGKDLQPTIDLIERSNPIGIFSCLDEDCVMPRATDRTFTDKLNGLWDNTNRDRDRDNRKSAPHNKYRASRLGQGFILTHYAAEVEYSTDGWLEKNKDPLNDNVTRLLAASTDEHMAALFADCAADVDMDDEDGNMHMHSSSNNNYNSSIVSNNSNSINSSSINNAIVPHHRSRVKKGLFRTVAQRHKEQLSSLMAQLHSTHPHFVRCILPNHQKRPKLFKGPLVLDQLRCNGVLEGIRIARTGFPNRLSFAEFRQRYEVLWRDRDRDRDGDNNNHSHNRRGYITDRSINLESQAAATMMLDRLGLDRTLYRVGLTKVFFRAGVLAELEEQRDALISEIMCRFQSTARGFMQRRVAFKRLYRAEATRVVQRNFQACAGLFQNPWWQLLVRMRPLLLGSNGGPGSARAAAAAAELRRREDTIRQLHDKMRADALERQRLEEERRACHGEMARVRQTLESERALALDKEEIFERLRLREAELEDKLAGALDDQERLEEQLDGLLAAKKRAEEDVERFGARLEQAASLMARLEEEKTELAARVVDLEAAAEEAARDEAERGRREATLTDEIKVLQSQLAMRERKTRDLEAKLLQADQDVQVRLMTTQKELQTSRARSQQLAAEKQAVEAQLAELARTSTDYEDLVRRKESELALLRGDSERHAAERKLAEERAKTLAAEKEAAAARLRDVLAEMVAVTTQHAQLRREAEDAKQLLAARLSEDARADQNRQRLEAQIASLKAELYKTQVDLSRERQSRDDVQLLGQHQLQALQEAHDRLNTAKVTIEKELYAQQDTLRRTKELRAEAEAERDGAREEIRRLRVAKTHAETARREAEEAGERAALQAARGREEGLRRDLEAANERVRWLEGECGKLGQQVDELSLAVAESGVQLGMQKEDQVKERLERELHTVRSRLAASENDNRALLNKLQQKGLEVARSSSRASEASRAQAVMLQREKARVEEHNGRLNKQLGDAQVTIASLEKKVEKLNLSVEDLGHEVAREVKTSRSAEKASSAASAQLAEARRSLESERQLRTQAQGTVRATQAALDARDRELAELRAQMLQVLRIVDPEGASSEEEKEREKEKGTTSAVVEKGGFSKEFDLVRKLEDLQQNLRVQTAARANAEAQLAERRRMSMSMSMSTSAVASPSRSRLEELGLNGSGDNNNSSSNNNENSERRRYSNVSTPTKRFAARDNNRSSNNKNSSGDGDSDETDDVFSSSVNGKNNSNSNSNGIASKRIAEVEELQNQLQIAQMQNRHLQSQLDRATPDAADVFGNGSLNGGGDGDGDESRRRVQKLEKANSRLHDMLDDSAKKVSALEKAVRTGELSLRDIQTQSHEEILDLVNSQEASRRGLLNSHQDAIAELADVREHFDRMRRERAQLEVDLRDTRSDLREMSAAREQEAASRSQLLHEFADLQIRLDAETAKLAEVSGSLALYKTRADEYFGKLEQAEIAAVKAARAEAFARTRAREADETCAEALAERKRLDSVAEDLARQNQRLEEKLEDAATDLAAALQAKKRLQHELEDYRSQRANDIEDTESSMEQTRRKYQAEFAALAAELDRAREEKLFQQGEMARLRDELDELRSKWDDEVLNSSTWSKEKARLEATLADVAASRDEAARAHTDAQAKTVALLGQVRALRADFDDLAAERDGLLREKRSLEARLGEARAAAGLGSGVSNGVDGANGGDDMTNQDTTAQLLDLRASLARQEDIAAAAVEKMRRAEALAAEVQKDMAGEREGAAELRRQKAAVEKALSEAQLKLLDLETKGLSSSASQDIKFLHKRIQELESQLETQDAEHSRSQRESRTADRAVKDLQAQLERREKQNAQLADDVGRMRDKLDKLLRAIDDLQASESATQLSARRAERDLREERDRAARLERELEGWKGLRLEKSGGGGPGGGGALRVGSGTWRSSMSGGEGGGGDVKVPERKSSIGRAPSLTKGFL